MDYRVEELAAAAGIRVDTVRFYQGKGLLEPPRREGRAAIYAEAHLERLRRIRSLVSDGFKLSQIGQLLAAESSTGPVEAKPRNNTALLQALVEESVGDRTFSRAELAAESGVPDALLAAAQSAGLFEAMTVHGEERFSEADLQMARAALALLGAGFPLDALLKVSVDHASEVRVLTETAIDLFDDHVISKAGDDGAAAEAIADAFRDLLPQATRLVALHFQRTLLNRALERLRARGDAASLERALAETESAKLEVAWRR